MHEAMAKDHPKLYANLFTEEMLKSLSSSTERFSLDDLRSISGQLNAHFKAINDAQRLAGPSAAAAAKAKKESEAAERLKESLGLVPVPDSFDHKTGRPTSGYLPGVESGKFSPEVGGAISRAASPATINHILAATKTSGDTKPASQKTMEWLVAEGYISKEQEADVAKRLAGIPPSEHAQFRDNYAGMSQEMEDAIAAKDWDKLHSVAEYFKGREMMSPTQAAGIQYSAWLASSGKGSSINQQEQKMIDLGLTTLTEARTLRAELTKLENAQKDKTKFLEMVKRGENIIQTKAGQFVFTSIGAGQLIPIKEANAMTLPERGLLMDRIQGWQKERNNLVRGPLSEEAAIGEVYDPSKLTDTDKEAIDEYSRLIMTMKTAAGIEFKDIQEYSGRALDRSGKFVDGKITVSHTHLTLPTSDLV